MRQVQRTRNSKLSPNFGVALLDCGVFWIVTGAASNFSAKMLWYLVVEVGDWFELFVCIFRHVDECVVLLEFICERDGILEDLDVLRVGNIIGLIVELLVAFAAIVEIGRAHV